MSSSSQEQQNSEHLLSEVALVLPFTDIDRTELPIVGGKAANLGEMTRSGLPVPPGFCVTTAAYALVAASAAIKPILAELATTAASDTARLAELASVVRAKLLAAPIPTGIADAIIKAYRTLGDGNAIPVAVRSSATAEDLPFASFAGQQDTYLNIIGSEALLDAVRRCWASLWTDRAVSYRASNGIDPGTVRLAVAVQRMVEAKVAGVLFTANPLTGKRRQAVIDASPGLGEAVVSGAVNPDHFVVNTTTGEIVERRLGDKRVVIRVTPGGGTQRVELAERNDEACLSDEQVRTLARLGARVEAHYGSPQDTEWAIDSSGHLWLTQARPITTLFPLPANAPTTEDELRVYLSLSVLQGVYRPLTPMGLQTFRLISSALATFVLGRPPQNPLAGLPFLADMGQRLFIDATPILRNALGRELVIRLLPNMEARSAAIFKHLVTDPRLASNTTSKWSAICKLLPIVIRTKIPLLMVRALLRPEAARKRIASLEAQLRQQSMASTGANSNDRLATFERGISLDVVRVVRTVFPAAFAGIGSQALATVLLKGIATPDEVQTVLRGLPHNPTTEMDLSLWALAQQIRVDPAVAGKVSKTPPEQLAQEYREGQLPPLLKQGLAEFLRPYGHRGVAEIDLGLARWSEDPTHILGVLANYLQLKNPELAPDVQFERGVQEAKAMVMELTQRARRKGWLYGKLVRFYLKRIRELAGIREVPKYFLILLLARGREMLWPGWEELARARRLEKAEEIFFVRIP